MGFSRILFSLQNQLRMDNIQEVARIPIGLQKLYNNIHTRCYCKSYHSYHRYGGRGITVCEEWFYSPEPFYKWCLSNGYQKGYVLDRRENDIGYNPSNCRFITKKESCRNRSSNKKITMNGETRLQCEWLEYYGMKKHTFHDRIGRGWDVQKALVTPVINS